MLNDTDKLIMFDDLLYQVESVNHAYDEQNMEIADMSKALWAAKQALDAANAALLPFVELADDEGKPKRKRKSTVLRLIRQ